MVNSYAPYRGGRRHEATQKSMFRASRNNRPYPTSGAALPANVPILRDVMNHLFLVGAGSLMPNGNLASPKVFLAAMDAYDVPGVEPPNFLRVPITFWPAAVKATPVPVLLIPKISFPQW